MNNSNTNENITKFDKSFVLCSTENYFDILTECVKSIREFSELPVIVYLINSDKQVEVSNTKTIRWDLQINDLSNELYLKNNNNFYIDRKNPTIYKILIQRPLVIKDALSKYSNTVCYVDSDSVATPLIDTIFSYFKEDSAFPYFVEGIYEFLKYDGRGGGGALGGGWSDTLEHNACELFNVDQTVRKFYRQTGYFVAGQNTYDFLDEWYWMCNHPKILNNISHYAPYDEETISNVLLWKYNIQEGLPYIYVNGSVETVNKMYNELEYKGPGTFNFHGNWLRVPYYKEHLLFFHGEKNIELMREMVKEIKKYNTTSEEIREYPNIDPSKNWGDIITKFILEHFSGKKLNDEDVFHFDSRGIIPFKNGKIIGTGSLTRFTKPNDYVWGTGCIDNDSIGDIPKKIYAVRGPQTREVLMRKGWEVPEIYGDPALLFPKIYNPKIEKKYKYGLIPHYSDYTTIEGLRVINNIENLGIKIINITSGIYEFIDELLECENILSSSLHGLIASDAYGIPNHIVSISDLIQGGDFKFVDYHLSVKREYHNPIILTNQIALEDLEKLKFEIGDVSIAEQLLEHSPWIDSDCEYFPKSEPKRLRVLYLAPHLSTGGMPSYLLKRIESISSYYPDVEFFLAEFCQYSTLYTVQRDRIKQIIPEERFWTINTLDDHTVENSMKVIDLLKTHFIDIVHVDEMIEGFDSFNKVPDELKHALYDNDRTWRVVETCHNIWFDPGSSKHFHPDAYALCTPYHLQKTFKGMPSHQEVFEYPIENKFRTRIDQVRAQEELELDITKVHIINVGLWTSGKNQGEGIEIARHFENTNVEFHFVGNQASNFESYWGPLMANLPSNVKVWGERNDVETFMKASDILMFNSTWECNPLVIREAASLGLKIIARDLPQYVGMFNGLITPLTDDLLSNVNSLRRLISSSRDYKILDGMTKEFAVKHYNLYNYLLTQEPRKKSKNSTKVNIKQFFINEPFLEIIGESNSEYDIKFFDEFDICHYHNKIKTNHWVKLNRQYFTKWNTKVLEDGVLIYDETLNYEGKRVFINFDSSSLGDTISWIPYVLEFKNTHKCEVVVSTYWNHLFREVYPELEFVEPGSVVYNIFGQYNIGWYYDIKKEPITPNTIPLQQAATNILGLPYKEIKPRISYKIIERPYEEKYVTIATNSTAGCKFWTKEGWQGLINYLHSLGYKVINVSKEDNRFDNCEKIKDIAMDYTMNVIHHSEFFIGLSSGLSWLSWAMGKHVVMISNFTEPDHEFTSNCTRITNPNVCNGCWNSPIYKFDKGDWNWCPVHKGTNRQFECHTSITPEMVINQIQHLLK
jgi:autotransporter strand-loop-strand O-heptosyltransferase